MAESVRQHARRQARSYGLRTVCAALGLLATGGCTRSYYRDFADRDVYSILDERLLDWRWKHPKRTVEAERTSRMADPKDPNHEPIPPDEKAARKFQISSHFPFEYHGWKKRGTEPVEFLDWQKNVPTDDDGRLVLGRDSIMREAMLNSRDYQTNYENLYLSALSLTLAEFQFMVQGFSRNGLFFQHFGGPRNDSNQLQMTTDTGFSRQFMTGAQLLVDFANTIVFEYSGKGFNVASPGLAINFTQPLLRGAWARIATQSLSLQERGVLYAVREFAHYRREFYVSLVAQGGYYGLLTVLQNIRNQEENLKSLERNLAQYEAELGFGFKSVLQRDQIAQRFQSAQIGLLGFEAGLQTQLDQYKIQLGLPPEMAVRLDDSILDPFQLNNPKLDALREDTQEIFLSLRQQDDASVPMLVEAARRVSANFAELDAVLDQASAELKQWRDRLDVVDEKKLKGPDAGEYKAFRARKLKLSDDLDKGLRETRQSIDADRDRLAEFAAKLDSAPTQGSLATLRDEILNKVFRSRLSEVFVSQTQIRVYLIELKPIDLTVDQAIQIALTNRLDLMNTLAQVTDAWRNMEVDANSLQGFLNFNYSSNLAAAPNHASWFRFDSSASSHRVGITFDAPINRRVERNAYRASQIIYQRARRQYMLTRDQIVQQIRSDMRDLLISRKQFDIGRELLITASRQVEQAEYALQGDPEGQPVTINLLDALNSLLGARNNLIQTWVTFESTRMNLFRDFDLMDVDDNGIWTNENDPELLPAALRIAAESPAFSLAIPAGIPDFGAQQRDRDVIINDVRPSDRVVPGEPDRGEGPLDDAELETDVAPAAERAPGPPAGPSPFTP